MKIQHLKNCLLIFYVSLMVGLGCTTQETSNPVTPEESSEIILENYQLSGNETWEPEKTYVVRGTLVIPQEITLNIPPGTTVKFGRDARLTVRGVLKAWNAFGSRASGTTCASHLGQHRTSTRGLERYTF